jgi:rubrerythrin
MISRRQLLYFSFLAPFFYPIANLKYFAKADDKNNGDRYPLTSDILKKAYWEEMIAYKHYDRYSQKALSENYPNIAYLFSAISSSEKIHADNYQRVIVSLASSINAKEIPVSVADTKSNLKNAAIKELEKIEKFYPEILKQLSLESYDEAIINCVYSWKSHKQHEEIIKQIEKHSGIFFKPLAKKIESAKPDYYVCGICGSTLEVEPLISCPICNHPVSHYKKIEMPILSTN